MMTVNSFNNKKATSILIKTIIDIVCKDSKSEKFKK